MKKKIFMFLVAMLSTTGAWADELTVFDGTAINHNVPANIYYFDDFTRSQYVIPASELSSVAGNNITSLKYYTTSDNVPYTTVSSVIVYLKEVNYTAISAYENPDDCTTVYSGTLDIVSTDKGGEMTIEFDQPFEYSGGNLLVGIENTTDFSYKKINFYGQTAENASISGSNGSSTSGVTANQQDFIPMTTFTYDAPPIYHLTPVYDSEQGTVVFTVGDSEEPVTEALKDDIVTVTVTPKEDFAVRKISGIWCSTWEGAAARGDQSSIGIAEIELTPLEGIANQWTFTMLAHDVEISIVFWSNDDIIELIRLEMIAAAKILNVYGNTMNPAEITPIVIAINDANFLLKRHEGGDVISIDEAMELYERLKAITDRYANIVTGIAGVNQNNNQNENRYYDLQGRRVAQPTKGLYIKNGKVVVVK